MKSSAIFKCFVVLSVFLVSSCEGEMQGVIQGSKERPKIEYTQGLESDALKVTLPNGEVFNGKLVFANQTSAFVTGMMGTDSAFGYGSASDGKMIGKLFSDRGRVMNCSMQYANAGGETSSGGVGECQIVNGEKIDVLW